MATFVLYQPVPEAQVHEDAKDLVAKSNEFFANNPKRRVARVGVWYGRTAKIRRKHVQEDVDAAVAIALKKGN